MEPMLPDRRRCVRQRVHSPAYVSTAGAPGTLLDLNEIFDVSIRGISFQNPTQLNPGEGVNLRLDFSETGDSIETAGRVAWSEPSGRTGVRFRKMPRPTFLRLKEWLFLNAIAACFHYEEAQRRKGDSASSFEAQPTAEVNRGVLGEKSELPDGSDYATILITMAAIRRDVEAMGSNLPHALHVLAKHARAVTCASGAAVALSSGEEMICRASAGSSVPSLGARIRLGESFSGECVRSGKLLRCDDSEIDPHADRDSCSTLGIRSIMAAPVYYGDAVVGLLEVFSPQPQSFRWKDEVYLRRLAEIIVLALKVAVQSVHSTATPAEVSALAANARPLEPDPLGFAFADGDGATPGEIGLGGSGIAESPADISDAGGGPPSTRFRALSLAAVSAVLLLTALLVPSVRRRMEGARSTQKNSAREKAATKRSAEGRTLATDSDQLRRLAEQGDPAAQFALGVHYAVGEDTAQDYSEAARWFSRAADHGHVTAQATLGAYYWLGRGVPQDLDKAYFWSVLAQAGGDEASKYRIPALASHLSRDQIIADQEMANNWLREHVFTGKTSGSGAPNSKD